MKNLMKSLAAFQQEMPPVHKGSAGHGYTYASLDEVVSKIKPVMADHNLGFTQLIDGGKIRTIIFHTESGEKLESEMDLNFNELQFKTVIKRNARGETYEKEIIPGFEGMNKAQAMGAMITYFRRYMLSSSLGIITDADVDACGYKDENTGNQNNQSKQGNPGNQNNRGPQGNQRNISNTGNRNPQGNQSNTGNPFPPDNREWLTERQLQRVLQRIEAGELDVYEKTLKAFKMKKVYRARLQDAVNKKKVA